MVRSQCFFFRAVRWFKISSPLTSYVLLMLLIKGPLIQEVMEAGQGSTQTQRGRGRGRGKGKPPKAHKTADGTEPEVDTQKKPAAKGKAIVKKRPAAAEEVPEPESVKKRPSALRTPSKGPEKADAAAQDDEQEEPAPEVPDKKGKSETFHNPSWHKNCNNWCLKSNSRHIMSVARPQNESQSSCQHFVTVAMPLSLHVCVGFAG